MIVSHHRSHFMKAMFDPIIVSVDYISALALQPKILQVLTTVFGCGVKLQLSPLTANLSYDQQC